FGASQDNAVATFANGPAWNMNASEQIGDGGFVRVDPFNSSKVYFDVSSGNAPSIKRSDDGGQTFHPITSGLNLTNKGFLADNPNFYPPLITDGATSGRLLFGTDRVYETRTSGDAVLGPFGNIFPGWVTISAPNTNGWNTAAKIDSLAFDPTDTRTIYATA